MESSEAAFERITAASKTSTAELPSRLFILTCDRPDALHRLLLPLVRQALPEHVEGLWVIDDSRDEHHQQRNAAISEEANNACELPIHYFGAEARASLIEQLISACPDHIRRSGGCWIAVAGAKRQPMALLETLRCY